MQGPEPSPAPSPATSPAPALELEPEPEPRQEAETEPDASKPVAPLELEAAIVVKPSIGSGDETIRRLLDERTRF